MAFLVAYVLQSIRERSEDSIVELSELKMKEQILIEKDGKLGIVCMVNFIFVLADWLLILRTQGLYISPSAKQLTRY